MLLAAALLAAALLGCAGPAEQSAAHLKRGQEFLADGRVQKARIEFQNALQIAPDNAEARYALGLVAERIGNVREAYADYQATIEADADHSRARARLARLLAMGGDPEKAISVLVPGLIAHPQDPALIAARGIARALQQDFDGALADARRAVQLAPDDEDAILLLAALHRRQNDPAGAAQVLESAVQARPSAVGPRQVLAQLYVDAGNAAAAEQQLRKLIELAPRELARRYALANLYTRARRLDDADRTLREAIDSAPADEEVKLVYAEFLVAQRTPAQAEAALRGFIALRPHRSFNLRIALGDMQRKAGHEADARVTYRAIIDDDADGPAGLAARNRLALLEVSAGRLDRASQLAEEVLQRAPRDLDALTLRGNLALASGDAASAVRDLRSVLREQPGNVPVLRTLARAHLADGDPALAEQNLRDAMAAVPADVSVQRELGELLVQTGHAGLAVRLLERTVLEHPEDREARDVLIRARLAAGEAEAARRAAQELLKLAPSWWPAHRDLAEAQAAAGDVRAAIATYDAGIQATDDQPELVVGLAALYEREHRIDDAVAAYERLRERRPDLVLAGNNLAMLLATYRRDPASLDRARDLAAGLADTGNGALLDTYGWVQLKRGDITDALVTLERAVRLSPASPGIRGHLGLAQFRAGQDGKARATLEAALSGNAEFAGHEEARSVLTRLQRRTG